MAYYLNLFSPETFTVFSHSSQEISGFREGQYSTAQRINVGDKLVCYMTKLSRWIGILEVLDGPFLDQTPFYVPENDPFIVRFHVKPIVWLSKEHSLPIKEDAVWDTLSFTKGVDKKSPSWTGKIRSSLTHLPDEDGQFLEQMLIDQSNKKEEYPLSEKEEQHFQTHTIKRVDKVITVTVPQEHDLEEEQTQPVNTKEIRKSIKIQALLAGIGAKMGLKIWIPKNDRQGVLQFWDNNDASLLMTLPLNYDDVTLKTIEQIDVLWLRGRSIVRAFEVEHTTSIYSGILRMADLLALQPNMEIKLHIVAPEERREKVFQEIRRPVFSLLEKGALAEYCTYLGYEQVQELARQKHLAHLSDTVIDEYCEQAE